MKRNLIIPFVFLSLTASAQFPAPTSFQFSYDYIMIGEWGDCDGQAIHGPTYCSRFNWITPDTTITSANLEYYNIYYFEYYSNDTSIIASLTDTFYDVELGVVGEVWVTAVYSNPDGESDSSNVVINPDLPISIDEIDLKEEIEIYYNARLKQLVINNRDKIKTITIYNIQGCRLMTKNVIRNSLNLGNFSAGVYIVEIITKDNVAIRNKIVK